MEVGGLPLFGVFHDVCVGQERSERFARYVHVLYVVVLFGPQSSLCRHAERTMEGLVRIDA